MAQLALSAVGAVIGGVIGFYAGGPSGAAYGAELGWTIGGVAGALLIHGKGPQPGDLRVQDSAYGRPIPILYGMYRAAGNVIWAGQPINESSGGKGSAPSQAKVSMSFAVGICAGPITGLRRIWANGKLIYDVSDPSNFEAISGSAQMVSNFTLYYGDESQMPDPTMEAALGAGNVPAHRGLAYVVFNGLDLSPWGNYMPSLSFEITTTQPTTAYSQQMAFYAGSNMIGMIPHLTAQGGVLAYYNYYVYYTGLYSEQMTPYGARLYGMTQFPAPHPGGLEAPNGTSDVDGLLAVEDGGYRILWFDGFTGVINYTGYSGGVTSFVRNLLDLYVTDGTTITYCTVSASPSSPVNGVSPLTGTHLYIVGLSPSYLYVTDYSINTLYRLHRNTMTVAASWVNTFFDINVYVGCVLDDDNLYFLKSGTTNFYHYSPASNATDVIGQWTATVGVSTQSLKAINKNFFVMGSVTYTTGAYLSYFWLGVTENDIALSAIVADICARAGLTSGQYDVSQLTDRVTGYGITNHSAARANLAPLMAAYFFDAVDTDGKLKFVRRGAQPIAAIAYGDLGASTGVGDETNQNPVVENISQEIDLPRTLSFSYSGLNNDYQVNTQRAFRGNTRSNKDATMSAPIVMADDVSLLRTQVMLWAAWVGRSSFTFATPLSYLQYEPGDVLTLPGDTGQAYTVRLVHCAYDGQGTLQWTAIREEPDIYPSTAYSTQGGAPSGFTPQVIDYSGPTVLAVLDVPPLRDSDTTQGVYLAACGYAANWPGAFVDISRDDVSFTNLLNITNASAIGNASGVMPNFYGGNQPDELSTVDVAVYGSTLASVTYANFMAGANAALLGGELIYFRTATQTGANTYTLSGFLRGRVGTEWAMGAHVSGERFVFLDPAKIAMVNLNLSDIGATLYFEPHLMNLFANQPVTPVTVVPTVARVKPLSPALFVAGHGSAASVSDISLSWIRRARVNAGWNDGADVPLDESAETYTLNIYSGSTLKRTVTVSAATVYTYTAANITADGFSVGNTITFTVAQNSDQGVLGYAATSTITR